MKMYAPGLSLAQENRVIKFFADVNDPKAAELNSLEDVEKEMPGFLDNTREWFR